MNSYHMLKDLSKKILQLKNKYIICLRPPLKLINFKPAISFAKFKFHSRRIIRKYEKKVYSKKSYLL